MEEYGDCLYRFALLKTRNPHDAEEVVQEALLAALKGRKNFSGRSTERTWLIGILKHKIIDLYRRKIRERAALAGDDGVDSPKAFSGRNGQRKIPPPQGTGSRELPWSKGSFARSSWAAWRSFQNGRPGPFTFVKSRVSDSRNLGGSSTFPRRI
jgi:hypothetical protein